jgi:hypothetical protein
LATEPTTRRRATSSGAIELEYRTPRTVYGLRAPSRTNSPAAVAANASVRSSIAVAPLA